jgi:pimeloyl-ACP methyl ester carboxylesterase
MVVAEAAQNSARKTKLPDGRALGYVEYGDPAGKPAIYLHGWPTSRLEASPADELARQMGVRLIAVDRPGCGASDFQPRRKLDQWPADVAHFADALALDRFALIGNSGGAPYAAACAARIPERITELIILCGLGPTDKGRAAGMIASARWALLFARRAPRLAAWVGALAMRNLTRRNAPLFSGPSVESLPQADRAVLRKPDVRDALSDAVREGFRQGARGPVLDGCIYAQPWPFALQDIRVPSMVWHGEKDTIVPVEMGRLYARSIPGCKAVFYPDEGHFSLPINRMKEIFENAGR